MDKSGQLKLSTIMLAETGLVGREVGEDVLVETRVVVVVVVVVLILYCHDGPWPIRHNE